VEEVVDAVYDVTTSAAQPTTSSQVCFIYAIHDNVVISRCCCAETFSFSRKWVLLLHFVLHGYVTVHTALAERVLIAASHILHTQRGNTIQICVLLRGQGRHSWWFVSAGSNGFRATGRLQHGSCSFSSVTAAHVPVQLMVQLSYYSDTRCVCFHFGTENVLQTCVQTAH